MKILFAGTPTFAVPALEALLSSRHQIVGVFTQPDRPAGRGQHMQASPVKQFALANQLPIFQPLSLRQAPVQQQIADLQPDVMIVAAYGLILPAAVLSIPRYGCINIHASLLPRWRGAAPIQRSILADDTETGITIMQMDVGLDTGDMLYKIPCPILPEDTSQTLHDRLAALGATALMHVLPQIENHTLQPVKQDETLATHAAKIQKTEALIDWREPAQTIANKIRAFYPAPGAHTFIDGHLLKIQQAKVLKKIAATQPGTILHSDSEGIIVATSDAALCLQRLQLAGGKSLPASEILKSRRDLFTEGKCFTNDFPPP